jgi:hypothetical protein
MGDVSRAEASRACFALAAGLEIAHGQPILEAVGRAKLASVLFDEIVFESGLHVVEFAPDRLLSGRRLTSADGISSALLKSSRTVMGGTKSGLAIRTVEDYVEVYAGSDIPHFPDAVYFEQEVAFRCVCEYHTGIMDELARLGVDWARAVAVSQEKTDSTLQISDEPLAVLSTDADESEPYVVVRLTVAEAEQLGKALGASANELVLRTDGAPSKDEPLQRTLAEGLAEAIDIADRLDAVPIMSSAYEQVARERGIPIGMPGAESLGFVIPNISALPWEAIAQFRAHEGSIEARARLREFEAGAAAREPYGSVALVRATGKAVSTGLLSVVQELSPSLPESLRGPILESAVGVVPLVGQYASLAISMGDAIATLREHREFQRSWVAAIFELRDAAVDTLIDW